MCNFVGIGQSLTRFFQSLNIPLSHYTRSRFDGLYESQSKGDVVMESGTLIGITPLFKSITYCFDLINESIISTVGTSKPFGRKYITSCEERVLAD